jgi:lysophospholipase L1-like esterase
MATIYDQEEKNTSSPTQNNTTGNALSNNQLSKAENSSTGSNSGAGGNYSLGSSSKSAGSALGKGYTGSGKSGSTKANFKLSKAASNKKLIAGGGIGAGIVTIAIVGFFSAASLKIESIVNDLQGHFFSTSENAVDGEESNLLSGYFKAIMPSYKKGSCGTTLDKDCSVNILGTNPVDNLYRAWSQAKLENTLAEKYGIEFKYDSASNTYYLKAPGTTDTAEGDKIATAADGSPDLTSIESEFSRSDRTELRSTVDTALKNETAWKQVFYRYKVGRLLEEKYGIKRCIIACGSVRDPLANFVAEKKNAMQLFAVQRVITPRNMSLSIVLGCLISPTCDATSEPLTDSPTTTCSDDCELNGAGESPEETVLRTTLEENAAKFGITDAETIKGMITQYNDIAESGYANYALDQLLTSVGLSDLSDQVSDATPIIGWINQAATVIDGLSTAGPKLKALSYATNAAAAVSLYMMYRSYADEMQSGSVDATEYGSFVNALGPGDHADTSDSNPTKDAEVGGTAGAEGTPLYGSIINGVTPTSTAATTSSLVGSIFNPLAYAASTTPATTGSTKYPYTCSNGDPVPAGQVVCSEEVLGNGNGLLSSISGALNSPPLNAITIASKAFKSTIGQIFNLVGDVFSLIAKLPGISNVLASLGGFVQKVVGPFEQLIVHQLIPDPFGTDESGGRTFDEMAAGADVSGNDESHNGLGGVALTPTQVSQIDNQQETQAKQDFEQEPVMARIFSTQTPYSLISRLADDIPIGTATDLSSLQNIFTNPISSLTQSFSTIINDKVDAATQPAADPFGVTQYGYPAGTIPADPGTYWDQNCADNSNVALGSMTMAYNQAAAVNPDPLTGQPENSQTSAPGYGTDPCLLIQAAVGSSGAVYDESLLTPDDLSDVTGAGSSAPAATNNNIYWVGDSLTVGMETGGLQADLQAKGYNVNKIEATTGDSVAAALPKVQADTTALSNAGTVVVELGTNDCSLSGVPSCESTTEFEGQIQSMISAIRSVDANATIYWVNMYTTKGTEYTSINQAITADSSSLAYKVIDWATEATTNPSKYSFDTTLGVHQTTGVGYQNMATFVTSELSAAPGTNVVAESIFGNQSQKPSLVTNVGDIFSKLISSVDAVSKKSNWSY